MNIKTRTVGKAIEKPIVGLFNKGCLLRGYGGTFTALKTLSSCRAKINAAKIDSLSYPVGTF